MPYIKPERRLELVRKRGERPMNAGELNYLWTMQCLMYLDTHGESYQTYNDIIGAIENCKMELYRRKISIYEDGKIKSNGDVF